MAPRTRNAIKREIAECAPLYNSRGFAALPLEILHQIVSCTNEAVIPWVEEHLMDVECRERRDVIRVICQLCRRLREDLLPLLWERLEACCLTQVTEDQHDAARFKSLSKELMGQLKVLIVRQPLYASYVRVVDVAIYPTVACDVLYSLAPALELMPNVHTVQIIIKPQTGAGCCRKIVSPIAFRNAFKDYLYPSVRSLILPEEARPIFGCFPEVIDVCLNQSWPEHGLVDFVEDLAKHCHKVEIFRWLECFDEESRGAAAIVENFPNLRRLEYHIEKGQVDEVLVLFKLQNLDRITLIVRGCPSLSRCTDKLMEVIVAAKSVLRSSPQPNRRLDVILEAETRSFTFSD